MALKVDVAEIQDELIEALRFGEEDRARELVQQMGEDPSQVRTVLEAMLGDSYGLARQAAVFGLGQLGGAASARRLEQQLAVEEARGDYDGEAVVEEIVRTLGRMDAPGARTSLMRRLERVTAGRPERSEMNLLALALWRRRHPEVLPVVRQGLERLSPSAPQGLLGLLLLLEKSPEEITAWAREPGVPLEEKTQVLMVLAEDVPDSHIPCLTAFVVMAGTLMEEKRPVPEAEHYCERLFGLLLSDRARLLVGLPAEARASLRAVARSLIAATVPNPSLLAAEMLEAVGRPEDASFLQAHRPASPTLAKVFDDAARHLLAESQEA